MSFKIEVGRISAERDETVMVLSRVQPRLPAGAGIA